MNGPALPGRRHHPAGVEAMKPVLLALAFVASLLAGADALAQPVTAQVTLSGTTIMVRPDPISVERARGAVVIQWDLPRDANYRFDPQGIVIEGEQTGGGLRPQDQIVRCGGGPRQITCTNRNAKRGTFKYTIRLLDANQRLIEKDPLIVNAE
jgi:hypothetical protein